MDIGFGRPLLRPPQLLKGLQSSTDSFTAPPPVRDHQMLHVMQPVSAAIVDLNQRTFAFKAEELGALFRHWSSVFSPRIYACFSPLIHHWDASAQLVAGKLFLERLKDK